MSDQPPTETQFAGVTPPARNVPDYLVWSILETILGLFCTLALPFGIVGIVFSVMANSKKTEGNIDAALGDAANAKKWLWIGLIVAGVSAVLGVLAFIAVAVIGAAANASLPY